jgi:hypothetical protein
MITLDRYQSGRKGNPVSVWGETTIAESELIIGFINRAREKFKFPKAIHFRKMRKLGWGAYNGNHMTINSQMGFNTMIFVILHELVHCEGVRGHGKDFWRRFIFIVEKMRLDPEYYFENCFWVRGKMYWERLKDKRLMKGGE